MTVTAGYEVPTRRPPVAAAAEPPAPDVVVRLHREAPLRPRAALDSSNGPAADLDQLTRAVYALVEALAPGVVAEVALVDHHRNDTPATSPSPVSEPTLDVIGDDNIHLDRRSRTLIVDGEAVLLTKREFELLAHLALHAGVALSRRELMNAVWHESYLPGDRTVDVHVRRVRVKLGAHAGRLNTLRGFGYRFD